MLHIDGTQGEGGGQVLRTALALAIVTGKGFRLDGIRGRRKRPGLQRQHLCCVQAAIAVSGGRAEGAHLDSTALRFEPGRPRGGDHAFAVGSAGSTSLVLQTVLPALLRADGPSTVRLSGGTHNPLAPPFEFLAQSFLPLLRAMGADVELQLVRHGFAPHGGGLVAARIAPATLRPLRLMGREEGRLWRARALISQLPDHVAERELRTLAQKLGRRRLHPDQVQSVEHVDADGPGNALLLEVPFEQHTEVLVEFGQRGLPAEQVAARLARAAKQFDAAEVPVGVHLADQLLPPLALAGGGAFRTVEPTLHCRTNAELIERFLPVRFEMAPEGANQASWLVECRPA